MSTEISNKQINAKCLYYLLNECVPLSIRVNDELSNERSSDVQNAMNELKLSNSSKRQKNDKINYKDIFTAGRVDFLNDETSYMNLNSLYRIEKYGFEVGFKVADWMIYSNSIKISLLDVLDIMKFICRDVWKAFYLKQMDNLRTNHVGTFVLIDNSFQQLSSCMSNKGIEDTIKKATPFLQFGSGLIRGVLSSLGVEAIVNAEIIDGKYPAVSFHVQTNNSQ